MKLSKKTLSKFSNQFQSLFKNIYVLYTLVIIAIVYLFLLLQFNNWNAIAFFVLLGLVIYYFTKNMAIILSFCILFTMIIFPITFKKSKEGLENNTTTPTTTTPAGSSSTIPEVKLPPATTPPPATSTTNDASEKKEEPKPTTAKQIDSFTGQLAGQSRIDPASTMTQAFSNLENMLGGEGISKLTNDTQHLVANQAKLFKTIENMTPLIEKASTLMNKFNNL